jgi:hypothetical protein
MENRPALWIVSSAAILFAITLPFAPKLPAQDEPKPQLKIEAIAARPEDVSSIEAIVKADYDCISGGIGVPRQWARDFTLYDPNARSFTPQKIRQPALSPDRRPPRPSMQTRRMRNSCAMASQNEKSLTRSTVSEM